MLLVMATWKVFFPKEQPEASPWEATPYSLKQP